MIHSLNCLDSMIGYPDGEFQSIVFFFVGSGSHKKFRMRKRFFNKQEGWTWQNS